MSKLWTSEEVLTLVKNIGAIARNHSHIPTEDEVRQCLEEVKEFCGTAIDDLVRMAGVE